MVLLLCVYFLDFFQHSVYKQLKSIVKTNYISCKIPKLNNISVLSVLRNVLRGHAYADKMNCKAANEC